METADASLIQDVIDNDYVRELYEIYLRCLTDRKSGLLDRASLIRLCRELHLEEHESFIERHVLTDYVLKIRFKEFKDRFIRILPQIIEQSCAIDEAKSKSSNGGTGTTSTRSPRHHRIDNLRYNKRKTSHIISTASSSPHLQVQQNGRTVSRNSATEDTTYDVASDQLSEDSLGEPDDVIVEHHPQPHQDSAARSPRTNAGVPKGVPAFGGSRIVMASTRPQQGSITTSVSSGQTTPSSVVSGHHQSSKPLRKPSQNSVKSSKNAVKLGGAHIPKLELEVTGESSPPGVGEVSPGRMKGRITPLFISGSPIFEATATGELNTGSGGKFTKLQQYVDVPPAGTTVISGSIVTAVPVSISPRPAVLQNEAEKVVLKQKIQELGLGSAGFINLYELKILYNHLGIADTSTKAMNDLFESLDGSRTGRVALDRFVAHFYSLQKHNVSKSSRTNSSSFQRPQLPPPRNFMVTNQMHFDAKRDENNSGSGANGSFTFFSMLNSENGYLNVNDLLDYWRQLGVESGEDVLELLNLASNVNNQVDVHELSTVLEDELSECSLGSDVLMAALITYRAELTFVKDSLEQAELQVQHYSHELQNVHTRNNILVEELDQSQTNLEKTAQSKIRETEMHYQSEIRNTEQKLKNEREQWLNQLNDLEETIQQLRTTETSLRATISRLERENTQLCKEIHQLHTQLKDNRPASARVVNPALEAVKNRRKFAHPSLGSLTQTSEDQAIGLGEQLKLWKQRAEYHMNENKELKDKVDELRHELERLQRDQHYQKNVSSSRGGQKNPVIVGSTPYQQRLNKMVAAQAHNRRSKSASFLKRCTAMKCHCPRLQPLKRRGEPRALNLESSELESELDPIIWRPRVRRVLTKRERRTKSAQRLVIQEDGSSSSEDGSYLINMTTPPTGLAARALNGNIHLDKSLNLARKLHLLEKTFSEETRELEDNYKAQITQLEETITMDKAKYLKQLESERRRIQAECEEDKAALLEMFQRERMDIVRQKEQEMRKAFDKEKHDVEVKWASERNAMERDFAEQKMEMMARLQIEFETELKRVKLPATNSSSSKSGSVAVSPPSGGSNEAIHPKQSHVDMKQLRAQLEAEILLEHRERIDTLTHENERLSQDLDGMRNGFEYRLQKLRDEHNKEKLDLERAHQTEKSALEVDFETRWKQLINAKRIEDLPQQLQGTFSELMDHFKVEQRNTLSVEQGEMLESFQRERAEWLRQAEEERDNLRKQHDQDRVLLEQQHLAEIQRLELKYGNEKESLEKKLNAIKQEKEQAMIEAKNAETRYLSEANRLQEKVAELVMLHDKERSEIEHEMDYFRNENKQLSLELEQLQSSQATVNVASRLEAELTVLRGENDRMALELSTYRDIEDRTNSFGSEIETLKKENGRLRKEVEELVAKSNDVSDSNETKKLLEENKEYKSKVESLENELDRLCETENDHEILVKKFAQVLAEKTELEVAHVASQETESHQAKERNEFVVQVNNLKNENSVLKSEIEDVRSVSSAEQTEKFKLISTELVQVKRDNDRLSGELSNLALIRDQNTQLRGQHGHLQGELGAIRVSIDTFGEPEQLKHQLSDLVTKCSTMEKMLGEVEKDLSDSRLENTQYKTLCDQYEKDLLGMKTAVELQLDLPSTTGDRNSTTDTNATPTEASVRDMADQGNQTSSSRFKQCSRCRADGDPSSFSPNEVSSSQVHTDGFLTGESGIEEESSSLDEPTSVQLKYNGDERRLKSSHPYRQNILDPLMEKIEKDEAFQLAKDNKDLKRRLEDANEKILELRACILLAESQNDRTDDDGVPWNELKHHLEDLQNQVDKSVKAKDIAQRLYMENAELTDLIENHDAEMLENIRLTLLNVCQALASNV